MSVIYERESRRNFSNHVQKLDTGTVKSNPSCTALQETAEGRRFSWECSGSVTATLNDTQQIPDTDMGHMKCTEDNPERCDNRKLGQEEASLAEQPEQQYVRSQESSRRSIMKEIMGKDNGVFINMFAWLLGCLRVED